MRIRGIEPIAGNGDQLAADPADRDHKLQDLFRLAAGRKRQDDVAARRHSQVAVDCFRGMQVKRGRARGTERCSDLSRDDPTLTHACNYYSAAAGIQAFHGPHKVMRHWPVDAVGQFAQRFRLNAHYIGTSGFHSRIILADRREIFAALAINK